MSYITLTADSGSTKTDWLWTDGTTKHFFKTQGINPFMLNEGQIKNIITNELICLNDFGQPNVIHFYGAGCRGEQCEMLKSVLHQLMPKAATIVVDSDLVGAAKALCGNDDGIACILGTGSNSGLYIGGKIVQNTSPLGFILGDEGSGAVLGKRFVGDLLKKQVSDELYEAFFKTYQLSIDDIIMRVYKQPFPNRFLASFAPFLHRHKEDESICQLLNDEFCRFFQRNINAYQRPDLKVSFVGSIAYFFRKELQVAAQQCGYTIGKILRSPLDGINAECI